MASRVFLDITDLGKGRMYVFDRADGRLSQTASFTLSPSMEVSVEGGFPEDMESCSVSIPMQWLDFRVLELELTDAEAVRQVLPFELDGLLMDDPADYVFDALTCGDALAKDGQADMPEGCKALAVYIRKEKIRALLAGLEASGADPRAVTSVELRWAMNKRDTDGFPALLGERELPEEPERVDLALADLDAPMINMRRDEFSFKGDVTRGINELLATLALFVSLMLVLSTAFSLKAITAGRQADALEQRVLEIYGDIFPSQKAKTARGLSYKVNSKLKEMRNKAERVRGVDSLEFMLKLQAARPEGLKYTEVVLDKDTVLLKGEASGLALIESARATLETVLADVKIKETGKAISGLTDFTIVAKNAPSADTGAP